MEILLPRRRPPGAAWPYRPRPLPDELLTSYLLRLAAGLNLAPTQFLSAVWGSKRSLLNQDLDNYAPPHIARRIADGTCISVDAVHKMTLASYGGTLLAQHNPRGRNAWLLPTTIKSNDRRRRGLQFCPECLATDAKPYFRRRWRLAFATSCTRHGTLLRDGCPACGEIVHPHRSPTLTTCFRCGESLCTPSSPTEHNDLLIWQGKLEQSLEQGWSILAGEPLYSHLMLAIVRQIAALLVNGPRAADFRKAAARTLGGDDAPFAKPTDRQPIEYLTLAERRRLFDLARRLMQSWPANFVDCCREAGLHRSHAIKDMGYVPFAYERVLRTFLDSTPYYPSEGEVAAAAAWLRRTQGHATYADLRAICGESRAAIYRHMDYLRRQARPSKWRIAAFSSHAIDGRANRFADPRP
jgi:hypothetical protein